MRRDSAVNPAPISSSAITNSNTLMRGEASLLLLRLQARKTRPRDSGPLAPRSGERGPERGPSSPRAPSPGACGAGLSPFRGRGADTESELAVVEVLRGRAGVLAGALGGGGGRRGG